MKRAQCITFFLLLGGLLTGPLAAWGNAGGRLHADDCAQPPSILSLVDFVAKQTGYPPIQGLPGIRVTSAKKLATAIGTAAAAQGEDPRAAYVPASKQILVGPDFDLCTALDRSFLVHELVHVHQYENGTDRRAPCAGWLEGEAYRTQANYLKTCGLAQDAFVFDLLGLLQSACAHF